MPEPSNRIILWRNTIRLFHQYLNIGFIGPFYKAGYSNYRVASPLTDSTTGNPVYPDIFACAPQGWAAVELTLKNGPEKDQLDKYKKIDPRSLSSYGCPRYSIPPETICSRLSFNDDGDHCEILVKDHFDVRKERFIRDESLRKSLTEMRGVELLKLPNPPFSLVPEKMDSFEVRQGLVDIVLQIFDDTSPGKTPYEMCEEGLERLFELVPPTARQSLTDKIKYEMSVLIDTKLRGYIEFKDGKYRTTGKLKQFPKSRKVIARLLQDWASSAQTTLKDHNVN